MKTNVAFIAIIAIYIVFIQKPLQAQFECHTEIDLTSQSLCFESTEYLKDDYLPDDTLGPFPVIFHVLRKDDSTMTSPLNDSLVTLIFNELRAAFMVDHIRISLTLKTPVEYLNDSELYDRMQNMKLGGNHLSALYDEQDAINIYITPTAGGSLTLTYQNPWGVFYVGPTHYRTYGLGYHARIIIHEMGHVFGLMHTFETTKGVELIRRDSANNCYSSGDYCCDTPAEPGYWGANSALYLDAGNCSLDSLGMVGMTDNAGWEYCSVDDTLRPDPTNYMTAPLKSRISNGSFFMSCLAHFTPEQGRIMRCYAMTWPDSSDSFRNVVRNKTKMERQIADTILVGLNYWKYPMPETLVLDDGTSITNQYAFIESGSSYSTISNTLHMDTLYSIDKVRDSDTVYVFRAWGDDLDRMEYKYLHTYDTTISSAENEQKATSYFYKEENGVSVLSYLDDQALEGVPILLRDPFVAAARHTSFPKWPSLRNKEYKEYSAPVQPNVLMNQEYTPIWAHQNSFYRIRVPYGLDADSGRAFNPDRRGYLQTGDLYLAGVHSNVASALYDSVNAGDYASMAVVFRTDTHNVIVNYKGHLISGQPLSTNSQRKIVGINGDVWFIYNDAGSIWLTKKAASGGQYWKKEVSVSAIDSGCHASMAVDTSGVIIVISGDDRWELVGHNVINMSNLFSYDILLDPDDIVEKAVVSTAYENGVIVTAGEYTDGDVGSGIKVVVLKKGADWSYTVAETMLVEELDSVKAYNPTIASDEDGIVHLAWEKAGLIHYARLTICSTGQIDEISKSDDQALGCPYLMHGQKPSIAIDKYSRPHLAWQTGLRDYGVIWGGGQRLYGTYIAHRFMKNNYDDPQEKDSWSREMIFALKNYYGLSPVVGSDVGCSSKVAVVWYTEETGGRIHTALGECESGGIDSWNSRTLLQGGVTPHVSVRSCEAPTMVYSVMDTIFTIEKMKHEWTEDTSDVDYFISVGNHPYEMRGAKVYNDLHEIGMVVGVYNVDGQYEVVDYESVADTTSISSHSEISQIVRTNTVNTDSLFIDIRRFVNGMQLGADMSVFDSVNVSWWGNVKNAENDTVVTSVKLGEFAKDSLYCEQDSSVLTFPIQDVYFEVSVEADPIIFPCVEWSSRVGVPYNAAEYSYVKRSNSFGVVPQASTATLKNSPNPFNPRTDLRIRMSRDAWVELKVYDQSGVIVSSIVEGELLKGTHVYRFDGARLPSGVYYCILILRDEVITRKIQIVK